MFFNLTFYSGDFCKIQRILAEILHSLLIMGIKKNLRRGSCLKSSERSVYSAAAALLFAIDFLILIASSVSFVLEVASK